MAGIPNPMLFPSGGDPLDDIAKIERSIRARSSASANLSRTFSAPTSQNVFTLRRYMKRCRMGVAQSIFGASTNHSLGFNASDQIALTINGTTYTSNARFRDPSAHLDIAYSQNGTTYTVSVNGVVVLTGTSVANTAFNTAVAHQLFSSNSTNYADMVSSHDCFVDGQALPATAFGLFHYRTRQWRPKSKGAIRAAVAAGGGPRNGWGANGCFLPFDSVTSLTTLGYDRSQSDTDTTGNNWTASNISLSAGETYDSLTDTPTNNFCVLNPLDKNSGVTVSNGGLRAAFTSPYDQVVRGSMAVRSGRWYWEVRPLGTYGAYALVGIADASKPIADVWRQTPNGWYYIGLSGSKYVNGGALSYGATFGTGDVIGVLLDMDAGTLTFYKNGVSQGVAATGLNGKLITPAFEDGAAEVQMAVNFGQQPFAYPVPDDALALCTKNLPVKPPVMKSADAFVAKTNSGANIVADLSAASPWSDWIRIYKRRDAAEGWRWQFSDDPGNFLDSSSTAAKAAFPALTGASYVGYALKVSAANGVATGRLVHTNGVASVVTDGLANSRKVVILKDEAIGDWFLYHPDLTPGKLLSLNTTYGEASDTTINSVTASGFTVSAAKASGTYRWISLADTAGLMRLVKHAGNGSADGPFDALDLLTAFMVIKRIDASGTNWLVLDSAREPYNDDSQSTLLMDSNGAEFDAAAVDGYPHFMSNGIKVRGSSAAVNASGGSYVAICIAAFPFRYANAR